MPQNYLFHIIRVLQSVAFLRPGEGAAIEVL